MRHHCSALIVSGVIFALVTILHILRLFYHWTIVVDGVIIPQYMSVIGVIVFALLAIWMFSASRCKNKKSTH